MPKNQIPAIALFAVCLVIVSLRAMEIEVDYSTEAMLYMAASLFSLACILQLSSRIIKAHRLRSRY